MRVGLAFYSKPPDLGSLFREFSLGGFRRVSAIHRTAGDRIRVQNPGVGPFQWSLLIGCLALLAAILLRVELPLLASMALFGAVAGWLLGYRLGSGVNRALVLQYQKWVLRDETLVLVETPKGASELVLQTLRRAQDTAPVTFLIRSFSGPTEQRPRERQEPVAGERLKSEATRLASAHRVSSLPARSEPLLAMLDKFAAGLRRVREDLSESVLLDQPISPAAEWLLDNGYVIEAHINDFQANLPARHSRLLPVLESDERKRATRIAQVARELVYRTDGRLNRTHIIGFLQAYQAIAPLKIAELWVLPLMLRFALIQELHDRGLEVDRRQHERELADFWANRLLNGARRHPEDLLLILAELARQTPALQPHFAIRLAGHLYDEEAALPAVQRWMEREFDLPFPEVIRQEQARQAADKTSVANAIQSLRFLGQLDWRQVFEELSVVEKILRSDSAGIHQLSDFETRDRSRQAVEEIARSCRLGELEVARQAVGLAREAGPESGKASQVSFYLIDRGRPRVESMVGATVPLGTRLVRFARRHPTLLYLGSVAIITGSVLVFSLYSIASSATALIALFLFLAAFPAAEIGVQIVNHLVTMLLPPDVLPKLTFRVSSIPDEFKTLVVVPMVLLTPDSIRSQLNRLEVTYLANRERNLLFSLLSDFPDAPRAVMPEDGEHVAILESGITRLNEKYGAGLFFLFHRERVWSESEQRWIGWERKRGKLEELNCYLNNAPHPSETNGTERSYTANVERLLRVGDRRDLEGVRFVITLDADTQMPPGVARRMVETLAHPLNRAEISADGLRVVSGYTIIQPRVSALLPEATATSFTRIIADQLGTDPYARAVSDAYQDLFGESIYHGKAIYDVLTFHRVLTGRFPAASILSHDLIEGCYVRVGLASDIELLERVPRFYDAWVRRLHRWIRGDWQILNWIFPRVPRPGNRRERNPLSLISRWKIADNLRRALAPVAAVALLLTSWLSSLPAAPGSLVVAGALSIPFLLRLMTGLLGLARGRKIGWRGLLKELKRTAVWTALLPHLAWISLDATLRVWYRRLISRRDLLEWETAQVADRLGKHRVNGVVVQTACLSLVSCFLEGHIASFGEPILLALSLPLALPWILSPSVADRFGRHALAESAEARLAERDIRFLRALARRTWRYFDDLVSEQTNWLPPDNSQEALHVEVTQRTSPTNIGMWLLSAAAAHDFGYLTHDQLLDRALCTFETIRKLDRYQGHLLNWYDTNTLEPLRPPYVSTVDSGNLLGCYIVLEQLCDELLVSPLLPSSALTGAQDCLEIAAAVPGSKVNNGVADLDSSMLKADRAVIAALRAARARVAGLQAKAEEVGTGAEPAYWAGRAEKQLSAWGTVIDRYFGWQEQIALLMRSQDASLPADLRERLERLLAVRFSLSSFADSHILTIAEDVFRWSDGAGGEPIKNRLREIEQAFRDSCEAAERARERVQLLREQAAEETAKTDLAFLYDPERRLFTIGYNPTLGSRDTSYYDLLASEARLAGLIAISRGELPVLHWFSLARPFGSVDGRKPLLSWSGTMFEYLMPLIFTRTYRGSLLDDACREAVLTQIDYGNQHGVPWGASESAFSALDSHHVYQYRAFGVPALALKREAPSQPVVAPYATALALMVFPKLAVRNLRRLGELGLEGEKGFYEAIDYTRQSEREGTRGVIVYAYMAHHQGMTLLAIDNVLNSGVFQRRFHKDPAIQAVEPLLFEALPEKRRSLVPPVSEKMPARLIAPAFEPGSLRIDTPDTSIPKVHLQSNGNYHIMVTNSGGGYSRWRDFDLTRWRSDTTQDGYGSFCYIRDLDERYLWSASFHPLDRPERRYSVTYSADRIEFRRRDYEIETTTQVFVSPGDDVEIRLLTLVNRSSRKRRLELTSYQELALATHRSDVAHPAFQKLFVQTEALAGRNALLAWRRLRSPEEQPIWATHFVSGVFLPGSLEFDTDRDTFIGRGRTLRDPAALYSGLAGRTGFVLDPVFSLRVSVQLAPGESRRLAFITGAGESRERMLETVEKYQDIQSALRALDLAWTHAQLQFRHLGIRVDQAAQFQDLASAMLYPNDRLRPSPDRLRRNTLGQNRLWGHGISGDLPIFLITVSESDDLATVREALLAHTFWRLRGLTSDLVILDYEAGGYDQPVQEQLNHLINVYSMYTGSNQPGGIHLRAAGQMPKEDIDLLLSVARVTLVAARGSAAQQLTHSFSKPTEPPPPLEVAGYTSESASPSLPFVDLELFNGLGGFTPGGRQYVIFLDEDSQTPAPWINVLANPSFGTLVSESGSGTTWCVNSQANRITPWTNDPVCNPPSDVIYIRDEDLGVFWTATPLPVRERDAYRVRHGQGYSIFEHNSHGIEQELTTFVPMYEEGGEPIRVQRLRLRNSSSRVRRLSITSFCDLVLGTDREETQLHVATSWDADSHSMVGRNAYHPFLNRQVTFAAMNPHATSYTGDRTGFIGRNRSLANPAALQRKYLSRRSGVGLDPCLALQAVIDLHPGEQREVILLLGQAANLEQARSLVERYRDNLYFEEALASTLSWWDGILDTIEVETPDDAVNFLLNRWLVYQTLSCRVWGRTAFYQSGGAIGFRDQLQDTMALVYALPKVARDHLVKAASRQFREGDVQHWWHESTGAGVRTRCSDDMLWLPYAVAHYTEVTGDAALLDTRIPFLEGPLLDGTDPELYFVPTPSMEDGTLFEHCRRAIDKAAVFGSHGLPLIGSGDWNDGMNRVGIAGRGESVWLAWFLLDVVRRFSALCEARGERELLKKYRALQEQLLDAVEREGWDGEWYRRAYFDDGTPLGSRLNREGRIDSLPQSWAVIAGGGNPARARTAVSFAEKHLVREPDSLVLLFTPPYDSSRPIPGYIIGYPPGVRENGGQYTHGSLWLALAWARLGDGTRAARLLKMMNPVGHARTGEAAERYRGEPYVVAADVYSMKGQEGRAGWTWYTGSSAWMYRIWIEEILGFKLRAGTLTLDPCLPEGWDRCSLNYRFGDSSYEVSIENPNGVSRGVLWVELNGRKADAASISLEDNGRQNRVVVRMGTRDEKAADLAGSAGGVPHDE